MSNYKNLETQNKEISHSIIKFHKKVKNFLKGRSMVDGYTVTIRDAIEAAKFINHFKDSLGLAQAVIIGISRQYISKLKNEDKPEIIEALKEIETSKFSDDGQTVDIDDVLYLGGKSYHLNLTNILTGGEKDQLGNLFRILTLHAPKSMQGWLDILQQMLMSNDRNILVSAIKTLTFLPDEVKKTIVEVGIDIYSEDIEIFYQLLALAAGTKDAEWKRQIIENELLPSLWNDTDDAARNIRIKTIESLSSGITDNNWKAGIIRGLLVQKLSSIDINIRASAAGCIWALSATRGCTSLGNEPWKMEIVESNLIPLIFDNAGQVASWSVKAIGSLSLGLNDTDWKQKIIKDHIQPRFFHKNEMVRMAAVEATGTILAKIKDETFKQEIVEYYLLEKLFDNRSIQLEVMESLKKIFSTIRDEGWKQKIVENDLLPKLRNRRENQTAIISKIQELFLYIEDDEWKQKIIEGNLFPKLMSRDWYIHSETLKMLGSLNKSIEDREWKQKIVEDHLMPRLISEDKDIQSSAAIAIGVLSEENGTEQWRKGIMEDHLLPKTLKEDDEKVRSSLFRSIGIVTAGIGDEKWRQRIVKDYLMNGHHDHRGICAASAEAICRIITIPLNQKASEAADIFLKNLEQYLSKDASFTSPEGSLADAITETSDKVNIGRFTIKKNIEINPHIPDRAESALVNTKTTVEDLEYLAAAVLLDKPVLEIGPTATRKSALIQYMASLTNMPYRRFNLNGQTDKYEFIGGYKPQMVAMSLSEAKAVISRTMEDCEYETAVSAVTRLTGEKYSKEGAVKFLEKALKQGRHHAILNIATLILDKESRLEWQDGILIEALRNGYYLNLDELNLSETEVLERLNSLLDDERSIVVYEHENEKYIKNEEYEDMVNKYIQAHKGNTRKRAIEYLTSQKIYQIHKNFRLFATMNPKEYNGRNKLSDPFLNRWRILRIEELPDGELTEIMKVKYRAPNELAMSLILFHQSIREQAEKGILGKHQREDYHFTIRDLIRVFERIEIEIEAYQKRFTGRKPDMREIKTWLAEAVKEVYGTVFRDEDDRKKYDDFYKKAFGITSAPEQDCRTKQYRHEYINTRNSSRVGIKYIVIGEKNHVELTVFENNISPHIPGKISTLTPVKTTLRYMKTIAQSLSMNEAIHLVGPTASAKTSIIRYLAHLTNSGFQRVSLAGQTDTADIIGQYQSTNIRGQYVWQDGALLQAMRDGDYLLLDELNLAEPQILERINSLLDTGRIVISEHNNETYIKARLFDKMAAEKKIDINDKSFVRIHENFRIIAASNPVDIRHQGRTRLSLAFRNRFREIWMEEIDDQEELVEIVANALAAG